MIFFPERGLPPQTLELSGFQLPLKNKFEIPAFSTSCAKKKKKKLLPSTSVISSEELTLSENEDLIVF